MKAPSFGYRPPWREEGTDTLRIHRKQIMEPSTVRWGPYLEFCSTDFSRIPRSSSHLAQCLPHLHHSLVCLVLLRLALVSLRPPSSGVGMPHGSMGPMAWTRQAELSRSCAMRYLAFSCCCCQPFILNPRSRYLSIPTSAPAGV